MKRGGKWLLVVGVVAVLAAAALFTLSFSYFKNAELQRAQNRASLYLSTLVNALERFQYLPFVLAQDPFVISAAAGVDRDGLNRRFAEFAARADLEAIYLMDTSGLTVAASNHAAEVTFMGQNYGFRPYFKEALAGRRGEFFGVGATTSLPGYFVAEAVRGEGGDVLGVVAIKLSLSDLAQAWAEGGETAVVSNGDGVVVLSSDANWLYRTITSISETRLEEIVAGRQFGNNALAPLEWEETSVDGVRLAGRSYLRVSSSVLQLGWTFHFLADESRVRERALFAVIAAAIVLSLLLALAVFLRSERIRVALNASQADRRQLRSANTKLEREIEERHAAEQRLERAQSELARASKLAALGQLSASVTHELGQPIAAMRNYLTAAELDAGDDDHASLFERLGAIVARMENITTQLKFFARPSESKLERVDLHKVLDGALVLVSPDLKAAEIELSFDLSDQPIIVNGIRLRLEQVLVNLLRNSVVAMKGSSWRMLTIRIGKTESRAVLSVEDTGHGLGGQSIEQLQDPFHTTRASGEGMGLGLAISAAIVKEHSGVLSAKDLDAEGAIFSIELPLAQEEGVV